MSILAFFTVLRSCAVFNLLSHKSKHIFEYNALSIINHKFLQELLYIERDVTLSQQRALKAHCKKMRLLAILSTGREGRWVSATCDGTAQATGLEPKLSPLESLPSPHPPPHRGYRALKASCPRGHPHFCFPHTRPAADHPLPPARGGRGEVVGEGCFFQVIWVTKLHF